MPAALPTPRPADATDPSGPNPRASGTTEPSHRASGTPGSDAPGTPTGPSGAASAHRLGSTDVHLTPLALGTMIMGTTTPEDVAVRMLDHFTGEVGDRFTGPDGARALPMLDTADCYCWWDRPESRGGESESLLGRWLARPGRRERVLLATKGTANVRDNDHIWGGRRTDPDWDLARTRFVGAGAGTLRASLDGSLRRLGVDHVDLYYVHVDDHATPLAETLETLAGFVAAGKVRYLGWSNVRTGRLEEIRRLCVAEGWPLPVAVQQQHSYLRRRTDVENDSIVDAAQAAHLARHDDQSLVAYSPILKGIYDDAVKRAGHHLWAAYDDADNAARLRELESVAAELGARPTQVVLAWLMAARRPRVLPLIGPRTWDQYLSALPALDLELPPAALARLGTPDALAS
ncbi:aldo/keto reductase [Actinotalea subterranea]|uniref:aldo/keto reductase n=1 Tax=Actinotalea subterranea TaxID=2607497 RepID=UPI0011EC5DEA|nr:aldo/keto reductase [Actinotalea subterranea]